MRALLRETRSRFKPNPLIDVVFWRRLSVAFAEACRQDGRRALDFGCGTGVMSETLAKGGIRGDRDRPRPRPKRLIFDVRTLARIIWPATLFEVLSCRKRVR